MSFISNLIGGFGQAVSGVASTVSDLLHGAADFVSSGQQQDIQDRYSAFESALSVLWLYVSSLQTVQQEFATVGNQSLSSDIGAIGQQLSALDAEIAENVIAPNTLSNVTKIFPGGLTFYLRGKELAEQNQILDTAFQALAGIHAQVTNLLSYYGRAWTVVFDNLIQSQAGTVAQALGSLKSQFLVILQSYASLDPSGAATSGLEAKFEQLDSEWRAASVALALQMQQISAATIVANNKAAIAAKLRQMGVSPALASQATS
jgi:hypothetical protein